MAAFILDSLLPFLALFGALALVGVALLVGFWPFWAKGFIEFLLDRIQAREMRRRRRSLRLARRLPR